MKRGGIARWMRKFGMSRIVVGGHVVQVHLFLVRG